MILNHIFSSPKSLCKRSKEPNDQQKDWISFCKGCNSVWFRRCSYCSFYSIHRIYSRSVYFSSPPLMLNSDTITSQLDSIKTLLIDLPPLAKLLSFLHGSSYLELCHLHSEPHRRLLIFFRTQSNSIFHVLVASQAPWWATPCLFYYILLFMALFTFFFFSQQNFSFILGLHTCYSLCLLKLLLAPQYYGSFSSNALSSGRPSISIHLSVATCDIFLCTIFVALSAIWNCEHTDNDFLTNDISSVDI